MEHASTKAPCFDDGSSTESEPYDEDELCFVQPAGSSNAKHEAASVHLGSPSSNYPKSNVLDLVPPPLRTQRFLDGEDDEADGGDEGESRNDYGYDYDAQLSEEDSVKVSAGEILDCENTATNSVTDEATEKLPASETKSMATCIKCKKATLTEVAELMTQILGEEARYCHCCSLTIPAFCFTKAQREAKKPACRGCRGLPTVVATLTARTKKLIDDQVKAKAPAKATNSKKAPPQTNCSLCSLPLEPLTSRQTDGADRLMCACCTRLLPRSCFSVAQRQKKDLECCKGCVGAIGLPMSAQIQKGRRKWKKEHSKALKELNKMKKKQARKKTKPAATSAMGSATTNDQLRASSDNQSTMPIPQPLAGVEEEEGVFRNRVSQYMFAVHALIRKREENDFRDSARVESISQLETEEAALSHQATQLEMENKRVFDEVASLVDQDQRKRPRTLNAADKRKQKTTAIPAPTSGAVIDLTDE